MVATPCGFESHHRHQLRNSLFGTNPRLAARLLSRTGNFFASEPDSLRWIPVRVRYGLGFRASKVFTFSISLQASYRLRRAILFHTWLIARSFCCSSLPTAIRFAGFAVGFEPETKRKYLNESHLTRGRKARFATTFFYSYGGQKNVIRPLSRRFRPPYPGNPAGTGTACCPPPF